VRQVDELAYAASHVASIELNSSFYALPTQVSWQRWRDGTPENFVFAVKGPRLITHLRRLRDTESALSDFFASGVLTLGPKLGPLLWQLPASLHYDHQLLERFLALLPPTAGDRPLRHAIEPRSHTFDTPAFAEQLTRHGVAAVLGDNEGRWPRLDWTTTNFAYARLHGDESLYASGYDDAALDRWGAWVRAHLMAGRDIFVYFDNDAKVHAPVDAMRLIRRLSA
jgi:uncharacterized protein YecE (DUF72 family)